MTAPTKKDVDAMSNLMKALNGDKSALKEQVAKEQEVMAESGHIDTSPGVKSTDIKAMENIMSAFNNASNNVSKKVAKTMHESVRTPTGVAVGLFSVEKTAEGYYHIRDNRSDDTLFEDICLYETAYIITKHLNDGKKVNSKEMTRIIASNAVFEQFYYDAMEYRDTYAKAKKRKDYSKMDVAEARFTRAKSEAGAAKHGIKAIYESVK
jgi:hypothetical protein